MSKPKDQGLAPEHRAALERALDENAPVCNLSLFDCSRPPGHSGLCVFGVTPELAEALRAVLALDKPADS